MKDYYLAVGNFRTANSNGGTREKSTLGTTANRLVISNYRQLKWLDVFPWLNYTLNDNLHIPYSVVEEYEYMICSIESAETVEAYQMISRIVISNTKYSSSESEHVIYVVHIYIEKIEE